MDLTLFIHKHFEASPNYFASGGVAPIIYFLGYKSIKVGSKRYTGVFWHEGVPVISNMGT